MIEPKPEITGYVLLKRQSDDPAISALEVYDDGEAYTIFSDAEKAAQEAWTDGEAVFVGKLELVDWAPPMCAYMTYAGSRHVDPEPPEYCEEPAALGSEYCANHAEAE